MTIWKYDFVSIYTDFLLFSYNIRPFLSSLVSIILSKNILKMLQFSWLMKASKIKILCLHISYFNLLNYNFTCKQRWRRDELELCWHQYFSRHFLEKQLSNKKSHNLNIFMKIGCLTCTDVIKWGVRFKLTFVNKREGGI